jgi:RNA ligase (TIGR02306 family)
VSYFAVEVIELPPLEPHPSAEFLSVVHLEKPFRTTVVCRTESWQGHKLAAYVPVDAVVSDAPEFEFMGDKKRVKAVKLRGVMSMGLLIPARPGWVVGQDVTQELGVTKYDDVPKAVAAGSQAVKAPSNTTTYTDIQSLRKYPDQFAEGEEVVVTEKVDGANFRVILHDNQLHVGSHKQWLAESNNIFWNSAFRAGLPEILMQYPYLLFFGEIYGYVQVLRYGAEKGEHKLLFFDIYDTTKGVYLDYGEFSNIMAASGLTMAPVLYKGPWLGYDKMVGLADGKSAVNPKLDDPQNFKEGFVVKSAYERFDDTLGRMILKYHSNQFLTHKKR